MFNRVLSNRMCSVERRWYEVQYSIGRRGRREAGKGTGGVAAKGDHLNQLRCPTKLTPKLFCGTLYGVRAAMLIQVLVRTRSFVRNVRVRIPYTYE